MPVVCHGESDAQCQCGRRVCTPWLEYAAAAACSAAVVVFLATRRKLGLILVQTAILNGHVSWIM